MYENINQKQRISTFYLYFMGTRTSMLLERWFNQFSTTWCNHRSFQTKYSNFFLDDELLSKVAIKSGIIWPLATSRPYLFSSWINGSIGKETWGQVPKRVNYKNLEIKVKMLDKNIAKLFLKRQWKIAKGGWNFFVNLTIWKYGMPTWFCIL